MATTGRDTFRRVQGACAALLVLGLAACGGSPTHPPPPAPPAAEQVSARSLPDTPAGAALQGRLGDLRLTGADRATERDAFELLARDERRLVDAYLRQHGRMVNTDEARELFPAYRADRSRAAAVHQPATELGWLTYARLLEDDRGEVDEVLFLAGGGGSGKTTALNRLLEEQPRSPSTARSPILRRTGCTSSRRSLRATPCA